jgi:hypothetical protein
MLLVATETGVSSDSDEEIKGSGKSPEDFNLPFLRHPVLRKAG